MEKEYYERWPADYFSGEYCRNCRFMYEEINGNGQKKCAWDGENVEPSDRGCSKFES